MKQAVIINQSLEMSKGKIARVCLSLGVKAVENFKLISFFNYLKWQSNKQTALIYKSKNYQKDLDFLDSLNIKYKEHVDVGITCVDKGSHCGCVFFIKPEYYELFKSHFKLL